MKGTMRTILRPAAFLAITILIMWTGASIAMADAIPQSPVTGTDWRGILSVIGVSLGGLGIFFSGAAKLLHAVAPLTKTTLDDRAAAKLDQVAEVVYAVRDHVLGLVKMASGPQQVQPDPVPAPELAVVPPRNTQAGRANVPVIILLAIGAGVALPAVTSAGCGAGSPNAGGVVAAVIDCISADHAAEITTVETEIQKLTNWSDRYAKAAAAGAVIGGCALLHVVTSAPTPTRSAASVMPDEDDGRATFEMFRRDVAGGAQYRTATGLR